MATGGASPPMTTTTVSGTESALVQLRVDIKRFMRFPAGEALHSDAVSVGGQLWRIDCYPRGTRHFHRHVSVFLINLTKHPSSSTKATFQPFILGSDGRPSSKATEWEYDESDNNGYRFYDHSGLGRYVVDGHITFAFAIVVINELGPVPVPSSDIRGHLRHMLDTAQETSDVSFVVGGEVFHAHRAVLAARSPVFKAQLFGSMIEATGAASAPIELHEIAPDTFRAMLRFMYTDAWPEEEDESPVEMFRDLLAAADRHALDRLKLMCARKLCDSLSVDTVHGHLGYR